MSVRHLSAAVLAAAVLFAGCKEQTPIPHIPTTIKIVSGAGQSADVSAALDSSLVIRVLDAADRAVSGVPLTWTVSGGGSLSAATTTSDSDGKSTVTWTLAPTTGLQVVTVTSAQMTGVSVSFVANNGATITGVVSPGGGTPFATFARSSSRSSKLTPTRTVTRRLSADRIVIGFKNGALSVPASASSAYRSLATARQTVTRVQEHVAALAKSYGITNAQISPAMVAARVRVTDPSHIDALMTALRTNPDVDWVERDEVVSIRDGAPRPMSAQFVTAFANRPEPSPSTTAIVSKFPTDPSFYAQYWMASMIDLPKAWSVTTGSASVIVAVVDMGIRFDHPDIAPNLTTDGYDFVSEVGFGTTEPLCDGGSFTTIEGDGDGPDPDPTDPDDLELDPFTGCWNHSELGDHGLWTAGIIGAAGNEGVGMTGVNWNVKIRPIRVLGITGDGTNFDIAQGILYAAGLPAIGAGDAPVQAPSRAQIINISLGGPSPSSTLLSAVTAASNAGSLIVASAGNDGLDFPSYPAAYPNVLAVSAVGQDGMLATYSNAGTFVSVAAPGGDYRLDDNGGGGVLGPGWNFVTGKSTYLFGYGTSASAPFVSGVAALMLAQTPALSAGTLRSRIEQFATRPAGVTRSDMFGWGILNAYNSLTQQSGPTRTTRVQLVNATTGAVARSTTTTASGAFNFTKVATGTYFVQAGDDESGDATIGVAGRRFGWFGGFGTPTVVNVNGNSHAVAITLGIPSEVEPNNDVASANQLTAGSYVTGNITTPDTRDMYRVVVPAAGVYTFETSGLVGTCGYGIELDTFLSVSSQAGAAISTNDNFDSATGHFCSRLRPTLSAGIYYVTVTGTSASSLSSHGRYRLEVRAGN